jgi:hypothetical protein
MQLIEYFLWKYQPCIEPVKAQNEKATKIGILVNHFEPIILWLAILRYGRELPNWITTWMVVFIGMSIWYTKRVIDNLECTTVTKESAPHLEWKWNNAEYGRIYYAYFLITLVLLSIYGIPNVINGRINAVIAVASFIISYAVYGDRKVVGAMWCWLAALCPYILMSVYNQ